MLFLAIIAKKEIIYSINGDTNMKNSTIKKFPCTNIKGYNYIKADYDNIIITSGIQLNVLYRQQKNRQIIPLGSGTAAFPVEVGDALALNIVGNHKYRIELYNIIDFYSNGDIMGELTMISEMRY